MKIGVSLHGQGKRAAPFGASVRQGQHAACWGPKAHVCHRPHLPHNHIIPFPAENHLGPWPGRLLTGRGAAARPKGAERLLQRSSGRPDPTEPHVPPQWGWHAPIPITPNSQSLLIRAAPAPYAIPATSDRLAATLPPLSKAFALLLPLPQHHGCLAG